MKETKTITHIVNKSKFVAYRFDVATPEQAKQIIEEIKKDNKKATHVCYAYVCCENGNVEKCWDDGEPSGTAGYPMLNVIKKKNLKNILVVVVRFFGGIKLGAGGLVRAYTKATSLVLDQNN